MKRRRILTQSHEFCRFPEGMLFSVNPGMPAGDALGQASNLLACVDSLAVRLGSEGGAGSDIFAIQYLAELAKALIDASTSGAYDAEGCQ